MRSKSVLFFVCLIFFLNLISSAQKYRPEATFLEDSLKIGYPTRLALKIEYPAEWQIFFPDSTSDFGKFEFSSKEAYPSFIRDSLVVDSVVYELTSFELDSIQKISLPVYRLDRGDTIELISNVDSIYLLEYIKVVPQELDLKENALHRFIPDIFNKKLFLILAGVVLIILILIGVLFGKKIFNRWKVYLMSQRHKKFIREIDNYIEQNRENANKESIETASAKWKDYLTELEKKPYNTYSTRDFIKHLQNEELVDNLKKIDAFVYGGLTEEKITDRLVNLKHFAEDRFELKKEEVQNA